MTSMIRCALLTFACGVPTLAFAQGTGLPTSQPTLVTIIREEVKVGRTADHARIEAGWPAAFGRANSPDYYLAMISLTGLPEAWYIIPAASNAANGERMRRYDNDAAMTAELERLSHADGEVVNSTRTIQAAARPDLSMGSYPDLAKQRFWEITIFRVRDQMFANQMKTMQSANAEEQAALQKYGTDAALSTESNRFRLDPKQSYVSRETRATDPAFWGTMPTRRPQ